VDIGKKATLFCAVHLRSSINIGILPNGLLHSSIKVFFIPPLGPQSLSFFARPVPKRIRRWTIVFCEARNMDSHMPNQLVLDQSCEVTFLHIVIAIDVGSKSDCLARPFVVEYTSLAAVSATFVIAFVASAVCSGSGIASLAGGSAISQLMIDYVGDRWNIRQQSLTALWTGRK
jgi:hypothetical protein